jgi:hypothetical protein
MMHSTLPRARHASAQLGLLACLLLAVAACGPTATGASSPNAPATPLAPTLTSTPALVWSPAFAFSDSAGFRYSVRVRINGFTPTANPASGITWTTSPDHDWLDLELEVTNLITDRPAELEATYLGVWGPCPAGDAACAAQATNGLTCYGLINGQCLGGQGLGFYTQGMYSDVPIRIDAGATVDFYADSPLPKTWSARFPTWTLWAGTGFGGGGPAIGGVPLGPMP